MYGGSAHRPSAEAVEAPKLLSDCQTRPECRESPSGCSCRNSREEHEMSPNSESYEGNAVAEKRAQRVLNEKVGERLPERRGWAQRLKRHPGTDAGRKSEPT